MSSGMSLLMHAEAEMIQVAVRWGWLGLFTPVRWSGWSLMEWGVSSSLLGAKLSECTWWHDSQTCRNWSGHRVELSNKFQNRTSLCMILCPLIWFLCFWVQTLCQEGGNYRVSIVHLTLWTYSWKGIKCIGRALIA